MRPLLTQTFCLDASLIPVHLQASLSIAHRGHSVGAEVKGGNIDSHRILRGFDAKLQIGCLDVVDPAWKPTASAEHGGHQTRERLIRQQTQYRSLLAALFWRSHLRGYFCPSALASCNGRQLGSILCMGGCFELQRSPQLELIPSLAPPKTSLQDSRVLESRVQGLAI